MSNVLIGIIGVILFIGLALAGALFLGPRFQESTNNAKASTIVAALQQIQSATNLYEVSEGKTIATGGSGEGLVTALLAGSYLKSRPVSPFKEYSASDPVYHGGDESASQSGNPVKIVFTAIPNTDVGRSVCAAIERQMGNANADQAMTVNATSFTAQTSGSKRPGCYKHAGGYVAYAFI